ncbi:MAG: hypothetical protein H7Y03_12440, partial [Chitinophagaceae bacterium]|nr:hypothetical protein [Chitinophagaceae bacterium]
LTTWHNGPNAVGCNSMQSDLDIIAAPGNGFGFRTDDHSNTAAAATSINTAGQQFLVDGIVNRTGDVDAFKINLTNTASFQLNAIPENVGTGNNGANVDIRVRILNSASDTIGIYNPSTLLNAGIDTTLNAGLYYVLVDGVGNINKSDYGSLGYYSMNGNLNVVLPVHEFKLQGGVSNGSHALNWSFKADEEIKGIVLESSDNGISFLSMIVLNQATRNFRYKSLHPVTYYRLKAITVNGEKEYLSNVLTLKNNSNQQEQVQLSSNIITSTINIKSSGNHPFELMDATGKLISKGMLRSGMNQVQVPGNALGLLFLRLSDGINQWTEKLIKP